MLKANGPSIRRQQAIECWIALCSANQHQTDAVPLSRRGSASRNLLPTNLLAGELEKDAPASTSTTTWFMVSNRLTHSNTSPHLGQPFFQKQFLGRAWASPTPTCWLGILSLAIYIYIYIGIGGPTAIFEPAPFLQPCTFFWPDLVDRKPPHRAAHNAHTDAQYKATEPRLLRAYRCKARLSPASKKYMTSGRIGFLFSLGLDRL